jgi:hypothetical protein
MIAVALMPFGMTPAAGAGHDKMQASMPMGHSPDCGSRHQSKGALEGCTMACSSALPASELARQEPMTFEPAPVAAAPVQMLHGLHPETATPPPRTA